MSGIYGSFLAYFGELYQPVAFFEQKPNIGAGWKNRSDLVYYDVIIQEDKGASIVGHSGRLTTRNNWLTLDITNNDIMWSDIGVPIKLGLFLIHPIDGRVYRVASSLEYNREGGFAIWGISKLTGDTGDQKEKLPLYEGRY